ncbi:hypothetical protein LAV84_30400, partial [Rhizobium sp. VS19-DR104.2]|uniref:hypothetical protein n=1 Tax=unclassified Rhizobium TaxID=2613769 RepID=UPI001CC403C8
MELDAGRNPARRHPPSLNYPPPSLKNAFAERLHPIIGLQRLLLLAAIASPSRSNRFYWLAGYIDM